MTWELRRIPLGPVVKISFFIYLSLGFLLTLLYGSFLNSIVRSLSFIPGAGDFSIMPSGFSLIVIGLFLSVLIAALYTVLTLLVVILYNAFASYLGGIEFEMAGKYDEGAAFQRRASYQGNEDIPGGAAQRLGDDVDATEKPVPPERE